MSQAELASLVERLERVASRLEKASGGSDTLSDEDAVFVKEFDEVANGSFADYFALSEKIGGFVSEQAQLVKKAFANMRDLLVVASKSKMPKADDLQQLLKPLGESITAVQDFREQNRRSEFFNHLSAVSEWVPALGWVAVSPKPAAYVGQMEESAQFYTNKVLKEYKEKDPDQADWALSIINSSKQLQEYVKDVHTTGLSWNPQSVAPRVRVENAISQAELASFVERLERVTSCLKKASGAPDTWSDEDAVFVKEFDEVANGSFADYFALSEKIGGLVFDQALLVKKAFANMRDLLVVASKSKMPKADDLQQLLKPIGESITAVQDFREQNRRSEFFNHLSAVSEWVPALGWVAVSPKPAAYVGQMEESAQFYTNKVLKEYKEKDPDQADWALSIIKSSKQLQEYVKDVHATGLSWNPQGGDALAVMP